MPRQTRKKPGKDKKEGKALRLIFETHAHYDDEAFDEDRGKLLLSMKDAGIGEIINVCAEPASLPRTRALMEEYPFVYGAAGIHPSDIGGLADSFIEEIRALSRHEKCLAIGEIGLDYYWDREDRKEQKRWFCMQLDLAAGEGLPVIIHSRDAAADTLALVKERHVENIGGVVHCFSYEKEMAREFVKLGLYLGIGGVLTYKNARKLKETVAEAPLDRLLLETDAPYLAPVPYRGKRNCSKYIPFVVREIAALKGISEEEVIETTRENALRLFSKKY